MDNKNTFLAMALSLSVVLLWIVLFAEPLVDEERQQAQVEEQRAAIESGEVQREGNDLIPQNSQLEAGDDSNVAAAGSQNRDEAIGATKRIQLENEVLIGSINLEGARIDDIKLKKYRETIDPESPLIELLSPEGSPEPYFAEFAYAASKEKRGTVPGAKTVWNHAGGDLGADGNVVLDWTNEDGVRFERTIALDKNYMFTITDKVFNKSSEEITLTPYGRVTRFEKPDVEGIFVLHEGLIGFIGEDGLQEYDYGEIEDSKELKFAKTENGWLGFTDKYWATTLIPGGEFTPRFYYKDTGRNLYQTDFINTSSALSAGNELEFQHRLYAGAKVTEIIDGYDEDLNLNNFDLMIDWGWFYFITKPLFQLIHWLNGIFGNFGVAILGATVIVKLIFLYFANLSYASMAKMKKVQPEMTEIRERFGDDKQKQQKAMMELYKKEKINPAAGCLPILIQIPVFFALYKVLFVTIEMRHAPFFGWVQDLAAPDPSSIWNLFGLIPWEPSLYLSPFLLLGIWPLLMGITMFVQMQMNPAPPDPTQAMIFKWMPVVFTFMLATFPAGLVIYWAWNNFLSIIQQGIIMKRHGAKIELFDNLKKMFSRKEAEPEQK